MTSEDLFVARIEHKKTYEPSKSNLDTLTLRKEVLYDNFLNNINKPQLNNKQKIICQILVMFRTYHDVISNIIILRIRCDGRDQVKSIRNRRECIYR